MPRGGVASRAQVSDLVNGKRGISKAQIKKLAEGGRTGSEESAAGREARGHAAGARIAEWLETARELRRPNPEPKGRLLFARSE